VNNVYFASVDACVFDKLFALIGYSPLPLEVLAGPLPFRTTTGSSSYVDEKSIKVLI